MERDASSSNNNRIDNYNYNHNHNHSNSSSSSKYRKGHHSTSNKQQQTLLEALNYLNLTHTHSTETLSHSFETPQHLPSEMSPLHTMSSSSSHHVQHHHQQHQQRRSSSSPHKRKNRIENIYNSHSNVSSHNNNGNSNHHHAMMNQGYCPSLSWRLDPDESLSDWTLTVVAVLPGNAENHPRHESSSLSHGEYHHLPTNGDISTSLSADDTRSSFATTTAAATLPLPSSFSAPSVQPSQQHHHHHHLSYSKKYFVHRTQLGVGPRRSEYFCKLFQNKSRQQQSHHSHHHGNTSSPSPSTTTSTSPPSLLSGKTRIELHPLAADAFPIMLDFMYSPIGTPPNVTTETAVALRQLATSFGIRELFDDVTDFIQHDINMDTAPIYLIHADTFRQDKLAQAALKTCAEHFEKIKFGQLAKLHPDLFERVVQSPDLDCSSEVLSARVAAYCRCRPGSVDSAMLQRMTDARLMPRIAPEESIFYLRLLDEMMSDDLGHGTERGKSLAQTSDLYKRCVENCHETIRNALLAEKTAQHERPKSAESRQTRNNIIDYQKLPDWIKVDVLESALIKCPSPDDVRALELAKAKSQERHASETAVQVAYLNTELDKLHKMYEKKVASYQATLRAQEQELRAYLAELSKFVRVPNHHRVTPLLSEYTYQRRQEIDEYGESIYGEVAPDDLPRFLPPEEDGWVLHEEVIRKDGNHDTQCWPMYYYKGDFQMKT